MTYSINLLLLANRQTVALYVIINLEVISSCHIMHLESGDPDSAVNLDLPFCLAPCMAECE